MQETKQKQKIFVIAYGLINVWWLSELTVRRRCITVYLLKRV